MATTAPTPVPTVISSGSIDSAGEKVPFSIPLTAGLSYQFNLEGEGSGNGTVANPYLQLISPTAGVVKTPDVISAGNARLTYTPSTSGTYTLDSSSESNGTGTYQLVASPQDDFTDDTTTTGVVAIGSSSSGALQAMGDQDYFKVALTAGYAYQFDLQGAGSGNGTLPSPYLQLISPTAGIVKTPDLISAGDAKLTYTPTTSGTYYLNAESESNGIGTYQLVASQGIPSGISPLGPPNDFLVSDASDTPPASWQSQGEAYTGPVAGINREIIVATADNINVTAEVKNVFIKTGSGEDALNVSATGGTNVLDGSTGSNFLVGGSGNDTFFVDDRSPADIWSTVSGFHANDFATVFGITQAGFALNWVDGQGGTGYTGLTLHATAAGKPEASLTLTGFTTADLSNGKLGVSFGTEADGTPYMAVQGH